VIPITNGEIIYEEEGEATYLDSMITYQCAKNYQLIGDETRMCGMEGKWSGASPKCEGKLYTYCTVSSLNILLCI